MISNENKMITETSSENFNFKKIIGLYTKQWKWFVLSILLLLGIAFTYLRYTIPQFGAVAKIMILAEDDGTSGVSALQDLSIFSENEEAAIEDEIEVITSRSFMQGIVKSLNLNLQYFIKGRINETEMYKNTPIDINFIATDSVINKTSFNFYVDILSSTEFNYKVSDDDEPQKIAFGENIVTPFGSMVITPKEKSLERYLEKSIRVQMSPVIWVAGSIRQRLSIMPISKSSKVLELYFEDPVSEKAKDIINSLIKIYNESTLDKKNIRSKGTVDFIDKRVELIASDLVNVDDSIVRFKTGNKVTDVTSEAGQFLASSMQNEQQLDIAQTQLRKLKYMNESLGDNTSFSPIPSNLGLGDPSISAMSSQYNELLRTRENKLKSAGERNPIVLELNQTLLGLKQNLNSSIQNSKRSLGIQISSLQSQSSRINSKIFSVPGQQSKLRSIERKQGIKESLYLYLLEKREEAAISLTATSPSVKVIDEAYGLGSPVFPDRKIIFIAALFLGLLIPFGFIYVNDLLDTKIHNKEDLNKLIKNITTLGEVPRLAKKDKKLVERNDRSVLSESFRIIRTNLDYVRKGRDIKNYENVIFVTSTINGEGKSFFSMNMALTLASTNKRVLIIGADIRNPQIFSAIKDTKQNGTTKVGLTEYLVDKSTLIGETINEYNINDITVDVLLSGKIPPNPAELLLSDRVRELFDVVSDKYDYVIVDTAPSMLVTDTLLISQYAGHTIYLTRADYTEKELLNYTKELYIDKKLNGMMLVVNDVNQSNFGYGAKYGYYGASEKKSWFKRSKA